MYVYIYICIYIYVYIYKHILSVILIVLRVLSEDARAKMPGPVLAEGFWLATWPFGAAEEDLGGAMDFVAFLFEVQKS